MPAPEPQPRRRSNLPALQIALIYAAVAGLWIFASDSLLGLLVDDLRLLTRIATYKGWGFVAITALMLYGLIRNALSNGTWGRGQTAPSPGVPAPRVVWPLLAMALLVVLAAGAGILVVRRQKQVFRAEEQAKLATLAQYKARQLDAWVEVGIHQVEYAAHRSILAETAGQWLDSGAPGDARRAQLQGRLRDLLTGGHHPFAEFLDRQGAQRLQAGESVGGTHAPGLAIKSMDTLDTLVHASTGPGGAPLVHIFTPLTVMRQGRETAVGGIHLVMDADQKAIPDLESSLRDTHSAEILLVGGQGGNPSFLNPRFRTGRPLPQDELLTQLPRERSTGPLACSQHLGAVAWSRHLPWGVIATEDMEVVFRATQRLTGYATLLGSVFVATGAVLIGFWMRLQRRLHAQQQEHQALERQLLEKRLDYLSRFANDIVLLLDDEGRIQDANDRACTAYGYAREELLGMGILGLRAPGDMSEFQRQWESARNSGASVFETTHMRKDGSVFPVEVSSRLVEIQDRRMVQSIIRDISERKASEEALRQTQKLESLGVLAGGIAHDFNNLLTALLGNLNLAQKELEKEHRAHGFLDNAEKTILKASDLTRQMLAYSGRGSFVVKPNSLNRIIQEMAELLKVSISKKVDLVLELSPDGPRIISDAAQIQQVVMNLVTNAADAIGEGVGAIVIRSAAESIGAHQVPSAQPGQFLPAGDYVRLEVQDDGCGMPPEVLDRIFDPFFTTKMTGRGLGLSAMLGILRAHQAGIRIQSQPGMGTRFSLFFPAAEAGEEASAESPDPAVGTKGARILLVDDEPMIRETAGMVLSGLGMDVTLGSDGEEALELFREGDFDLVALDLTMPRMDGREAFRAIRQLRPGVPIIVCSGFSEQEALLDAAGRPPTAFLPKPYSIRALEKVIAEVLATET